MLSIEHYWSTNPVYQTALFSRVMSDDRFQFILRFLHSSGKTSITTLEREAKVKLLINNLNNKMRGTYNPEQLTNQ